jgi:hypothetical protein
VIVTTREVTVPGKTLSEDQEKFCSQIMPSNGMIHGIFWHRIDIASKFEVHDRSTGKFVRTWE